MKREFPEHLNLPPLVELDGYGCCIECRRNIKAGRRHRPLCTILARKREARHEISLRYSRGNALETPGIPINKTKGGAA